MASLCITNGIYYYLEITIMNKHYSLTIRYFIIMLLLLFITGIWMLFLHTPLNVEAFTNYYINKSIFGLLEIITPHLFAMGTTIFILSHFLALKNKNSLFESKIAIMLFTTMLISNFAPLIITTTATWIIWLKIISTLLFILLSLLISWKIFFKNY